MRASLWIKFRGGARFSNRIMKYTTLAFKPKEINEEQHTLRAVFSTGDVDRHGEIVDQKSWLLDNFMKNPVVLFGHDHYSPPVGMITGLGYNSDGNLEGTVKFAADEYPFAKVIWNLYKGGFMKAFSVGFSSGHVDIIDDQIVLKDNELFEISTVAVPANAMALAKSKGIDVKPLDEKFLEQEKTAREKAEDKAKEEEQTEEETVEEAEVEEKCGECGEIQKDCPCKKPKPAPVEEEEEAPAEVATEEETVEETVEEAPAEDEEKEVETEIQKAADVIVESVKEGRVLSKANRGKVQSAVDALQALLDADAKEDKDVKSENSTDSFIKVETPAVRISVPAKGANKAKLINKAVRALLAEKRKV